MQRLSEAKSEGEGSCVLTAGPGILARIRVSVEANADWRTRLLFKLHFAIPESIPGE